MAERQIMDVVLWILRFVGVGGLLAVVRIGWRIIKWVKTQDEYNKSLVEALGKIETVSNENHRMLEQRTELVNTNEEEHSSLRLSLDGLTKATTALTDQVRLHDGRIARLEKRRK